MKKITPYYQTLEEGDIIFAYVKKKPNEVFPAYYQGYDKNWEEHFWSNGEGTVFSDKELVFVDGKNIKNDSR